VTALELHRLLGVLEIRLDFSRGCRFACPHQGCGASASMSGEHDTRIWRGIEHHVNVTRAGLDFSGVTEVGCDETSARRGQDYVSLFMDLEARRVMFATPCKDAETVNAFTGDLAAHGGVPTS